MKFEDIFKHVDHTALGMCCTWPEVEKLCDEAVAHHMASVCIPPAFVKRVHDAYGGRLAICTVIGFPLGYQTTRVKLFEAQDAIGNGADEIDMVINIGDVKAGSFDAVTEEIRQLRAACHGKVLKVIVETCYLTEAEKIALCHCVSEAKADYIKTSTGFGTSGANLDDIALFRRHLAPGVKIKASGGLRTYDDFVHFLDAGCDRLGTSSAMKVYAEMERGDAL